MDRTEPGLTVEHQGPDWDSVEAEHLHFVSIWV